MWNQRFRSGLRQIEELEDLGERGTLPISDMTAIQLDLFSGNEIQSSAAHIFIDEQCPRGINNGTLLENVCNGCPLRGLCDADECGMKCYEIDQTERPHGDFEDWLSEYWD